VRDAAHRDHVQRLLDAAGVPAARVRLECVPSNDSWSRDHGPITVHQDGVPRLLDFRFNGWGGKYAADLDDRITARLAAAGAFATAAPEAVDFVLEGGGIESDGEGTLLTTAQCLLTPGRNPRLDRAGIERELLRRFGLRRVLWLEHGHLEGDDTDSHIDTLARFCDARTIAYQACADAADAHHADLAAMERELQALRTADGAPYRLVPLPWPGAKRSAEGRRLPASYANFLIIDGAVLVPTYRDPADALALERLAGCFPGREIVGIDCLPLIEQNGSLHCITMQLPRGVLAA
jgi:agmatine deiminase